MLTFEDYFVCMKKRKTLAIVAHDNRKLDLMEWVEYNAVKLSRHKIVCTGTTGRLIEERFRECLSEEQFDDLNLTKLKSGPLGGDQQLGSLIVNGDIDVMIFFWDPMMPQPHDVDVKALLRITVLYNLPTACNRSTADFLISSDLFNAPYFPRTDDFSSYINRDLDK